MVEAEVVACELDGGAALLDLRSSTYFALNPVGAFVWERLGEASSLDDLCAAVCAHYDVSPEQCQQDLSALMQALLEARLVRAIDAPAR